MSADGIRPLIDELRSIKTDLHQGDFLLTWERSRPELEAVMLAARALRELYASNISTRAFRSGVAVANFRDQSTRTRYSYAAAANMLGLTPQELDESKSQIAHGETVRETANMISFATEVIGIRDDLYLGQGHKYMKEVAAAVDEGFREGVLPQRPAVINLQCDLDHPTQSLADLLHLQATFGSLDALRGKKIAMTWAYSPSYGKPLSVPQGIITLLTRFGMNVALAHPPGYELVPETLADAERFAGESGGSFTRSHNMEEAFANADIVYPKSWAPLAVMRERTRLLKSGDSSTLAALEKECLSHNARYNSWECDAEKMSLTREGQALYMHCLPADISGVSCDSGEVAADVFERYRKETYHQAGHKPFVIAAMILLTRFADPAAVLEEMIGNRSRRKLS